MGQGVGQGGREVRPEEVPAPGGAQDVPAASVGGGADFCLVGSEQEAKSKDYKRGCRRREEAIIYAAMSRIMVRGLARS